MCKACVQASFSLFPFMLLFSLHLMFLEWWTAQVGWEWEVVSFFLAAQRNGIVVGSISRIPLLQPFLGILAHINLELILYKSPNHWKQNSRTFCSGIAPFLNPCLLPTTKFPHGQITKGLLKQICGEGVVFTPSCLFGAFIWEAQRSGNKGEFTSLGCALQNSGVVPGDGFVPLIFPEQQLPARMNFLWGLAGGINLNFIFEGRGRDFLETRKGQRK